MRLFAVSDVGSASTGFIIRQNNPAMRSAFETQNSARQDKLEISPGGRLAQLIERLNESKQLVIQQKEQLIQRTLDNQDSQESGPWSLEDIQDELDLMNQQIEDINTQIADAIDAHNNQQISQISDPKKQPKSKRAEQDKEEQQLLDERLNDIAGHAESMAQIQVSGSVKATADNHKNQLEHHTKQNRLRIDLFKLKLHKLSFEERQMTRNWMQDVRKKEKVIQKLQAISNKIDIQAGQKVYKLNQEIAEQNKKQAQRVPDPDKSE